MGLLLNSVLVNVVDSVAVIFVLIFIIVGLVKGFVKMFFSTFGTILGLIFALLLCPSVARFMENEFSLVTNIANGLGDTLTSIFGDGLMNTTVRDAVDANFTNVQLGGLVASIVMDVASGSNIPTDTTLNQIICPTFAYYIVIAVAVLILFIIFKVLFFLIGELVNKLHVIKAVAVVDRVLGVVMGLLSGMFYLELVMFIIGIIPIGFVQEVNFAIGQTIFANFVHNIGIFNIILRVIAETEIVGYIADLVRNALIVPA